MRLPLLFLSFFLSFSWFTGALAAQTVAEDCIRDLSDATPETQINAAYTLSHISGQDAIPPLQKLLSSANNSLAWAGAYALAQLGNRSGAGILMQSLARGRKDKRMAAADALGEMKTVAAVTGLLQIVQNNHDDEDVRWSAIHALGKIGDTAAIQPLIRLTGDDNWYIREAAAYAVYEIAGQAALVKMLKDPGKNPRWAAVTVMGETGDPAMVPALVTALADPDRDIRRAAAMALGNTGDAAAVPALVKMLADPDRYVRCDAALALGRTGGRRARDPLIQLLQVPDGETRTAAVKALGDIGDTAAGPALLALLPDTNETVHSMTLLVLGKLRINGARQVILTALKDDRFREIAAYALGEMGDQSVTAALKEYLNDIDYEVIKAAISSLAKLGDTRPAVQLLKDKSSEFRIFAVGVLRNTGNESIMPALAGALLDRNQAVRFTAAFALNAVGGTASLPFISPLVNDREGDIRWAATTVLGSIGTVHDVTSLSGDDRRAEERDIAIAAEGARRIISEMPHAPRHIIITKDNVSVVKWRGISKDIMHMARAGEIVAAYGTIGNWYQLENGWVERRYATAYQGGGHEQQ